MKPYITTWEAAEYYKKHKNKRFSPAAFRRFLLEGARREMAKEQSFAYEWNMDLHFWIQELHKFDLCFWTWVETDYVSIFD